MEINELPALSKRNELVQLFRGCAIIAVVMIHTTPLGYYQVLCRPFINFGVATFLFLSGYLTTLDRNDWAVFFKKRIIRVLIPYVIWTTLYSIPPILHGKGIIKLVTNLISASAAPPLYYIFVYIQFVLLTPFLGKLAKSRYRLFGWFIAPFSVLFFKYYFLLSGKSLGSFWSIFWDNSCLGWFSFYYLGLILRNGIFKKDYSLKMLSILYAVSLLIQICEACIWQLLGDANCGSQLKLSSMLSNSLFCLFIYSILAHKATGQLSGRTAKILSLLGDYSFGIYLCHIMVMNVFFHNTMYNSLPYPLNSFFILIVSFFSCYFGTTVLGKRYSRWLGLR